MRIFHVLRSMASREAGRLDLALARGIYLVVAMFALMLVLRVIDASPAIPFSAATPLLFVSLGPSVFLLIFLAGRLGGDAVGDFSSGLLDLIFVTGLKPRQWLAVRMVQMWVGFFSVWIVRLPILVCLFAYGKVEFERIVLFELLLLTGFLLLSSLALVGSFKAKSRQQVWSRLILPLFGLEVLLNAPGIIAGLLARYYGWPISTAATTWMDKMAAAGLGSRLWKAMMGPLELAECLPTFVLYAVLAGLALLRFLFRLGAASQGLVDAPAVDRSQRAEYRHGPQRVSRRCWDDALAWQAFCVHGYGKLLVQVKCVGYFLLTAGLLISLPLGEDYTVAVFVISAIVCFLALLITVGKPSDCLTREIRDETMPTLLLTPNGTDDFYRGWQRGSWHLAWPDIAMAVVLALAGFSFSTFVPPITVSLVLAILFGGPFMMLSPLVPMTFKGIATGLGLTFVFVVIVGICLAVGGFAHPVFVPLVLVPLTYLFNRLVRRRVLPYWMDRKITSIV